MVGMVKNEMFVITTRGLSGGDPQGLGGHPHWTLHLELLVLGAPDEVAADLLQGLDVPGCQSDSDAVDGDILLLAFAILKIYRVENTDTINLIILRVKQICWKATIKTPATD